MFSPFSESDSLIVRCWPAWALCKPAPGTRCLEGMVREQVTRQRGLCPEGMEGRPWRERGGSLRLGCVMLGMGVLWWVVSVGRLGGFSGAAWSSPLWTSVTRQLRARLQEKPQVKQSGHQSPPGGQVPRERLSPGPL